MVLAIVLWWGISAHWAIPLVWLASGVAGRRRSPTAPACSSTAARRGRWPIPVVYALAGLAVAHRRVPHRAQVPPQAGPGPGAERLPRRRRRLPAAAPKAVEEPTDFDAELLGWVYDLALQPLDEFKGFDWGEQIHGPTCVRYQLNMLGYGLALYAANYLPNAPQPVEAALANLIEKADRPPGLEVLAHAQPDRQLRRQPGPDRARQHHAVGLPRRADQPLRGGHRLDPLRRAAARSRSCGRTAARSPTTTTRSSRPCGATSRPTSSASSRASRAGCSPRATPWAPRR